jgi:hypothetical protein
MEFFSCSKDICQDGANSTEYPVLRHLFFCGGEPFLRMRNEGEERGRKIWGFFLVELLRSN